MQAGLRFAAAAGAGYLAAAMRAAEGWFAIKRRGVVMTRLE